MNETSFTVFNRSQTVKISPETIYGFSDALHSYLGVNIQLVLRSPDSNNGYDLMSITAQLKLQNPQMLLSEATIHPTFFVQSNEMNAGQSFNFNLDDKAIHYIEENRQGSIYMTLEMTFIMLAKNKIGLAGGLTTYGVSYATKDSVKLSFEIPRSIWVERILPKLGFRNLKLVEVPLNHELLNEAYPDIIFEFEKAEHYFTTRDYNKCVGHCRNTLDALHRNFVKLKKGEKMETSFQWLETVSVETLTWLKEMDKASFGLSSKSHHAGQKKEFQRHEAESVFTIVLGLLNYIGHIKP